MDRTLREEIEALRDKWENAHSGHKLSARETGDLLRQILSRHPVPSVAYVAPGNDPDETKEWAAIPREYYKRLRREASAPSEDALILAGELNQAAWSLLLWAERFTQTGLDRARTSRLRVALSKQSQIDAALRAPSAPASSDALREALEKWHRRYPIQDGPNVPWYVMEPFEAQCMRNHSQTLQRIAERGGFGACEAYAVTHGIEYRYIKIEEHKKAWFEFAEKVNKEHADRIASLRAPAGDEYAWLIERKGLEWWTGMSAHNEDGSFAWWVWTKDAYEAVRFCRCDDAVRVAGALGIIHDSKITEHGFMRDGIARVSPQTRGRKYQVQGRPTPPQEGKV